MWVNTCNPNPNISKSNRKAKVRGEDEKEEDLIDLLVAKAAAGNLILLSSNYAIKQLFYVRTSYICHPHARSTTHGYLTRLSHAHPRRSPPSVLLSLTDSPDHPRCSNRTLYRLANSAQTSQDYRATTRSSRGPSPRSCGEEVLRSILAISRMTKGSPQQTEQVRHYKFLPL